MSTEFLKKTREGLFTIGETMDESIADATESAVRSALKPSRGSHCPVRVVEVSSSDFSPYAAKGFKSPKVGQIYPTMRHAAMAIGAHLHSITTAFSIEKTKAHGDNNVLAKVHGVSFQKILD